MYKARTPLPRKFQHVSQAFYVRPNRGLARILAELGAGSAMNNGADFVQARIAFDQPRLKNVACNYVEICPAHGADAV